VGEEKPSYNEGRELIEYAIKGNFLL